MNYEALIIQAAKLADSEQYVELESICQRILKKKPKHFDALQLLGLAQSRTGQLPEAIRNLKRARKLNPQHASVHINLANACLNKGQAEEAIKYSREAIKLDSSKYAAHIVLGNALQTARQYDHAEQAYEQALQLNPASAETFDSLGECYRKQGKLSEAVNLFLKANELNPALSTVYVHLLQTLLLMHVTDDAAKAADAGLTQANLSAPEAYELWIGKAKIAWLTGRLDLVHESLEQSEKIVGINRDYGNTANLVAYSHCLKQLLAARDDYPQLYEGEPEQAIFYIAESHTLSPSEVVVSYQNTQFRLISTLITGCKAWHLANQDENEYKASLQCILSALPAQSLVVLGFGEIDCRLTEGILKVTQEKNTEYQKSIDGLINDYLALALKLAEPFQHRVMICGVPAPSAESLSTGSETDQAFLCDIIQVFNRALKAGCKTNKLAFLDIYDLTKDDSGRSNQLYHIDAHHIHPQVFPMLFENLP